MPSGSRKPDGSQLAVRLRHEPEAGNPPLFLLLAETDVQTVPKGTACGQERG
jgi:hypothetical protein